MDWMKLFENSGVPMIILGFLLWFIVKPLFDAFVKNIEKQTEILQQLLDSCQKSHDRIDSIQEDVHDIKSKLEQINK